MVVAYRNDEDVLQARLGALLDNRSAEVADVSSDLRAVYARRVARAAAGGVASLGGAALLVGAALRWTMSRSLFNMIDQHHDGSLVALLGGSVLAGALAYLPARALAARAFTRSMSKALELSGNVRIDLVRVERARPRRIARDLIDANESWSASLPLVATALLAPLALHFLVWLTGWLFFSAIAAEKHLSDFDGWITMSAPIAGIAHLVLVMLAFLFAMRLRFKSTAELRINPSREGWQALGFTSLAGMIPGAVLILIPPLLIGFTGLLFIPFSFSRMNRAILREREIVEAFAA
jgi:hypothetical protein